MELNVKMDELRQCERKMLQVRAISCAHLNASPMRQPLSRFELSASADATSQCLWPPREGRYMNHQTSSTETRGMRK
jgi:hypothetical protein